MDYISISDIFRIQNKILPKRLDYMHFEYKGITFNVYGVLHGLIGGTNKEYRDIVNATIKEAKGLKFCEKSMKSMYQGLDHEVDDWVQMPFRDVFRLTLSLLSSPMNLWRTGKALYTELVTKEDRFGKNDFRRIQDIGGSMAFHMLHPNERRLLAGFLPPEEYLKENILRRENKSKLKAPIFPDPDWSWLTLIEPYANIPLRSIHMLEMAVLIAKEKSETHASIFIGEIHNTDMEWYATRVNTPEWMEEHIAEVVKTAEEFHKNKVKFIRKLKYLGGAALGTTIPMVTLLTIYFVWKNFGAF